MNKKKKIVIYILLFLLFLNIFACGKKNKNDELIIFAAASMTETLKIIGNKYITINPNVKIIYNFDSSGILKKQIEEGTDCDIFISASTKQINQLLELDILDNDTYFNLIENKVVLVVTDENIKRIKSFDDLVKKMQNENVVLAIGDSDVPVGQYTQKIFNYYDIKEKELSENGVLTYASNVKEVTTQVKEGIVDCGIVYESDAISANLTIVDYATKDMCGQVIYPVVILKKSKNRDEADKFLHYLKNDASKEVFKSVGLTPCS